VSREEAWARRVMREAEAEVTRGHRRGAANCERCGKFKSRPSSVCGWCGDDPVGNATNGDPAFAERSAFDRAHGYAY
jgi:hypothetical protein